MFKSEEKSIFEKNHTVCFTVTTKLNERERRCKGNKKNGLAGY